MEGTRRRDAIIGDLSPTATAGECTVSVGRHHFGASAVAALAVAALAERISLHVYLSVSVSCFQRSTGLLCLLRLVNGWQAA